MAINGGIKSLEEAKQQAKEVNLAKSKLNLLNEQHRQKQREYQDLRTETIKVIQGTSRLNVDLLNSLVDETSEQIKQLGLQIQTATAELEETVQNASQENVFSKFYLILM